MTRMEETLNKIEGILAGKGAKEENHPHDHKIKEVHEPRGTHRNLVPRVEVRKFDGRDVRTWLSQMEQYFCLHQVATDKKISLASLHMETYPF